MQHYLIKEGDNRVGCIRGNKALKLIDLLVIYGFEVVIYPKEKCDSCQTDVE